MAITPNEIFEREFSVRFRGYDRQEVSGFLEEVANYLAAVTRERNELRDKILLYKKKISILKQQESEFRNVLTTAHQMSEDMKVSAEKEAEIVIERARVDADRIVEDAHQEAIQLEDRIRKLRMLQRESVHKMRSSFEGFIRILDDEMRLPPEGMDDAMRLTATQIRAIQDEEKELRTSSREFRKEPSADSEEQRKKEDKAELSSGKEIEATEIRDKEFDFEPGKLWPKD